MTTSLIFATVLALQGLASASVTANHPQRLRRTATKANNVKNFVQPRIIGGSRVKNPYPYFALLEQGCGATLIHDDSKSMALGYLSFACSIFSLVLSIFSLVLTSMCASISSLVGSTL
jgi:hypothetical protein